MGTGYSFCDDGGFSTTETEVAENLYSALTQFYTIFSEYQANDFYITGEVMNKSLYLCILILCITISIQNLIILRSNL